MPGKTDMESPRSSREGFEASREASRASEYRSLIEDISETADDMQKGMRESGYARLPDERELNRLLFKIADADTKLPADHPLREQLSVQEHAALETVEDAKKARRYLTALQGAAKKAHQFRVTIDDRESRKEAPGSTEGFTEGDRELKRQMEQAMEQDIQRQFKEFYDPIFRTFPTGHPLRRKHAAFEEELKDILFGGLKEREEAKRELEQLSKTLPSVDIPKELDYGSSAPPERFDVSELVPEGMTVEKAPERKSRDLSAYRDRLTDIYQHVLYLERELIKAREKGDAPRREELLAELMQDHQALAETESQYGKPALDEEGERIKRRLNDKFRELYGFGHDSADGGGRQGATAAWMPRVPMPPYRMRFTNAPVRKRAILAVAPAPMPSSDVHPRPMPPIPGDIEAKTEDEKLAYLEGLLKAFQAEHTRLVDEHNALVRRLTDQVKERKLQVLRESLT